MVLSLLFEWNRDSIVSLKILGKFLSNSVFHCLILALVWKNGISILIELVERIAECQTVCAWLIRFFNNSSNQRISLGRSVSRAL